MQPTLAPAAGKAERAAEAKSKAKGMRADAPEFVPVPRERAVAADLGLVWRGYLRAF